MKRRDEIEQIPNQWGASVAEQEPEIRIRVDAVWRRFHPPGLSAEDLHQIAIQEVLEWGRKHETRTSNPVALATVIAERRAIDSLRQSNRFESNQPIAEAPGESPERFDDGLQSAIVTALGRLDPDDRELLRMRFVSELKLDQIAKQRGVTHQSASAAIVRALDRLRGALFELADNDSVVRDSLAQVWPEPAS
jgi:RNA polymerase sigma factor (sigma-70 family)